MLNLSIDGKKVTVEKGATVLHAAKKLGIEIPTLCYHEGVSPYGACRVCVVEVVKGMKPGLTASCTCLAEEGMEVNTGSPRVVESRKLIIELLLARSPEAEKVKDLARKVEVEEVRFKKEEEECILCGLCVRVCQEIIGANVIGFINRGANREVETPFQAQSDVCIGCGACSSVCPTGAIKIKEMFDKRILETWHTELELKSCKVCGKYFAPKKELEQLKGKIELPEEIFEICMDCKRKDLSRKISEIKTGII
ncbi:MAG: 2Fe-2S iron-sulfur cluster-binding protein [bacterium]